MLTTSPPSWDRRNAPSRYAGRVEAGPSDPKPRGDCSRPGRLARVSPTRRIIALVVVVAALAAIALTLPLRALPVTVAHLGPMAPVVGVAVGAALLIAMIPRTP